MRRRIVLITGLLLAVILIWYHQLIIYGFSQAKGQLSIIWQARPVQEVLKDPNTPDSITKKLKLVREIKNFAVDSMGLQDAGSYQSFYNQNNQPVMWVVSACEPFALKNKQWNFPFIGTFSYKGFFNKKMAQKELERLKTEGWDTRLRTASAWSTLGIFEDPVLSGMLFRPEGNLANLIIHELTHATIFIKDSLSFNENLASFIGHQGAKLFLNNYYGRDSHALKSYLIKRHDSQLFREHFLQGTQKLDSLYNTFTPKMKKHAKEDLKRQLIKNIVRNLNEIKFKQKEKYRNLVNELLKKENLPNNAYFMAFKRYQSKQKDFKTILMNKFNGDLKEMVGYYKEKYGVL